MNSIINSWENYSGKSLKNPVIPKRKFRWTFEGKRDEEIILPKRFVKVAARPNLRIEEEEVNFLSKKTWIPGKQEWETTCLTYYDTEDDNEFYDSLGKIYEEIVDEEPQKYFTGKLELYSGNGDKLETWTLKEAFVTAVNFGDLDFSSSEAVSIELTIKYNDVVYTNP
jgi:hypothetical protein